MDSYQYESNTLTWHDLSGNGNDFFWSNIPMTDYTKGFLNMNNLFWAVNFFILFQAACPLGINVDFLDIGVYAVGTPPV